MTRPISQSGIPYSYSATGRGKFKMPRTTLDRFNDTLENGRYLHPTKGWKTRTTPLHAMAAVSEVQQRKLARRSYQRPQPLSASYVENIKFHVEHDDRSRWSGADLRRIRAKNGVGRPPKDKPWLRGRAS